MLAGDGTLERILRVAVPLVLVVELAVGVMAVLDRQSSDTKAAERRGLLSRGEQLTATALAPGSALACLDSGAGEAAETACETAVFASAGSTAAAVAYVGARLSLLAEAKAFDPAVDSFPASRRAVELDRYGIAAHVLSARDGCTAERCAAFAWLTDAAAIKANMKAQAFDQYVSRHASAWNAPAPAAEPPAAVSSAPPAAPVQSAAVSAPEQVAQPLSSKYTLPSAASIPAVSIMNAEPPLPKGAAEAPAQAQAAAPKADAVPGDDVPMPPKRPQAPGGPAAPAATVR